MSVLKRPGENKSGLAFARASYERGNLRNGSMRSFPMEECHEHDLDVQKRTPVLYVIDVAPDTFAQIGVAPKAVDRGPTGHPRDDIMAGIVVENFLAKSLDELWALWTRADEA